VRALYLETKTTCYAVCAAQTNLTAPRSKTALYLWLDVTSGSQSERRRLRVLVMQ
jgi:hypothetical protein